MVFSSGLHTILSPDCRYSGCLINLKCTVALSPVLRQSLSMAMMEAVCRTGPTCTMAWYLVLMVVGWCSTRISPCMQNRHWILPSTFIWNILPSSIFLPKNFFPWWRRLIFSYKIWLIKNFSLQPFIIWLIKIGIAFERETNIFIIWLLKGLNQTHTILPLQTSDRFLWWE